MGLLKMIKRIIKKLIPLSCKKQLKNFNILANSYGQFKSINKWSCIDANENKIPWYTYPSIEYLQGLDFSKKNILEFGSGNSSSFWSNRAASIVSVEHDVEWFDRTSKELNNNQKLLLKSKDETYENCLVGSGQKFNVVIIDGVRRPECSKVVDKYLDKDDSDGHMVILTMQIGIKKHQNV